MHGAVTVLARGGAVVYHVCVLRGKMLLRTPCWRAATGNRTIRDNPCRLTTLLCVRCFFRRPFPRCCARSKGGSKS